MLNLIATLEPDHDLFKLAPSKPPIEYNGSVRTIRQE